jgi:hypothetical protein
MFTLSLISLHGIGCYLHLLQSKLTSQNKQLEVLLASHSELRGELSSARKALKNRAQSSAKRYCSCIYYARTYPSMFVAETAKSVFTLADCKASINSATAMLD